MSVRTGDREEGKLEVLNKAKKLKSYTYQKIKTFPKSTRWMYAEPIVEEVRSLCLFITKANSVFVQNDCMRDEMYKLRRLNQEKARCALSSLFQLIEDAYVAHYIDGKGVHAWTGMAMETQEKLTAWIKSDKERYDKICK